MERCQCQARLGRKAQEKKKKISPSNLLLVSPSSRVLRLGRTTRRRSDLKHRVESRPPPSTQREPPRQPQWVKVETIKVNLIPSERSPYESGPRLRLLKAVVFGAAARREPLIRKHLVVIHTSFTARYYCYHVLLLHVQPETLHWTACIPFRPVAEAAAVYHSGSFFSLLQPGRIYASTKQTRVFSAFGRGFSGARN